MKYLAVLFLGVLVEGSSRHNCDPDSPLDPVVIYDLFEEGAFKVPKPIIESGDDRADEFSNDLNNAIKTYAMTLLDNVVCQAIHAGKLLSECIKNTSRALQKAIKSDPNCLDDELQNLTDQLKVLLKLQPGNIEIPHPVLPPLPEQAPYESRTTKRTLKELFLGFELILNSLPRNVYGYISAQFLQGWRDARLGYRNFSTELRNEILNEKVLVAAKIAVNKVYSQKDLVQKNVSKETWRGFEDASGLIIASTNDYNATKNDEPYCSTCTQCPYTT